MVQSRLQKVIGYVVLILFLLIILAPFYWMFITSFKQPTSIAAYPPSLFPHHWTFANYTQSFERFGFGVYLKNSVIVAITSTFLVLVFSSLAGFTLSQLPVRGKVPIMVGLLVISMFPPIAIISPLYTFMRDLNWLNTYQALIIPYTAFNLPFSIWILRNYFLQVPKALMEAAKVDGAAPLTSFWRIYLPLTTPGLFTAAVFTFVATWTEFFMALVFNSSNTMRTIPVGIALFSGEYTVPYGNIFAASVVSVVPIILLVIIFRKWIVSGLTAGAVKG